MLHNRIAHLMAGALGVAFCISAPAISPSLAAGPQPPIASSAAPQKVAVLDAGDFITVEAHDATVGEVLDALKERLKLTLANPERVDRDRIVTGSRVGNIQHILSWLVPSGGFVVFYTEPKAGMPARPERVGFLDGGAPNAGLAAAQGKPAQQADSDDKSKQGRAAASNAKSGGGASAGANGGGDKTGKPDVADTGGRHEPMTVPEQLRASSDYAANEIERQANDPTGRSPAPAFLAGPGNVAQLSIEEQMQRSQALATSQLQALQNALRAACQGRPGSVC